MLTFSHYRFKQYLKHKADEYGKQIVDVNETYTSKNASWTGEVIEKLGSKKFIRSQGVTVDRDINGARGIMLRALRDRCCITSMLLPAITFNGSSAWRKYYILI